jgi:two-component system autoinducer 1 sensor kinase/phosphatase LuxN
MIINLLKNSLYYLNTRKDFRISILVFIEDDKKIVSVIDNGPGISSDDLEKVFDTFYTKKISGNGIGLSFCKKVMEYHGGSISCTSSLGEYTKIELRFV